VIDTWKKALLAERIRELGVICRTWFDHTAWRVWEELDFAAAMIKGERLVEAEFQREKAERALLAELLMRRAMYDLIEAWQLRIPRDLHPYGLTIAHEYLAEMRNVAAYSSAGEIAPHEAEREIARLAGLIRRRVVGELRWHAEKEASVGYHKDAYRLRRQADRFEASHVSSVLARSIR
jgi:hypothetical protein